MQQRDPGRSFVLGERLQYVLLPGLRTQDEAAEDPLTAVLAGQQADFELYWRNKLLRPLSEMFAVCLNPSQLHTLLSGWPPQSCLPVRSSSAVVSGLVFKLMVNCPAACEHVCFYRLCFLLCVLPQGD